MGQGRQIFSGVFHFVFKSHTLDSSLDKLVNWIAYWVDLQFMALNYDNEVKIKQKKQLLAFLLPNDIHHKHIKRWISPWLSSSMKLMNL